VKINETALTRCSEKRRRRRTDTQRTKTKNLKDPHNHSFPKNQDTRSQPSLSPVKSVLRILFLLPEEYPVPINVRSNATAKTSGGHSYCQFLFLPSFPSAVKLKRPCFFCRPYYKLARLPRCIYYPATCKCHCKTPWPTISTCSQALSHQGHLKRRGRSPLRPCDMCHLMGYQNRLTEEHES